VGGNTDTIKKNTESLLDASKEVGLEVNLEKAMYMLMSRSHKIGEMRWSRHVACMREGRNLYRVLVGKPEGKRPLERPRHKWDDGIKMNLGESG
jgi:hypothetical protein